jgi:hypothetical protein
MTAVPLQQLQPLQQTAPSAHFTHVTSLAPAEAAGGRFSACKRLAPARGLSGAGAFGKVDRVFVGTQQQRHHHGTGSDAPGQISYFSRF